jgi:hypothetical protein
MKRMSTGDRDRLMQLCVDLTKWNLGTLIVLALAFGGGLAAAGKRINDLDKKVNYILALTMGVIPKENNVPHGRIGSCPEGSGDGSGPRWVGDCGEVAWPSYAVALGGPAHADSVPSGAAGARSSGGDGAEARDPSF